MSRILHGCRWLSLVPAAMVVAGAFLVTGCGSGVDLDEPPTVHPDVEKNTKAMEDFYNQKKQKSTR